MILAFLRAINPLSQNSGIIYPRNGYEIQDKIVTDTIAQLLQRPHTWRCILGHFDEIIMGDHYFFHPRNRGLGSKGLLDFLIFPLVARKLLYDVLYDLGNPFYRKLFALPVGLCLEILRKLMGIILFGLLSPLMMGMYMVYCLFFMPEHKPKPKPVHQDLLPGPSANEKKIEHLNLQHPEKYICPISCQLMTHPLKTKHHHHHQHHFERDWIKVHFSRNGNTNPLTREPLSMADLEYDGELKKEIDTYIRNLLAPKSKSTCSNPSL